MIPGFVFDTLLGFSFIMDNKGKDLGEWTCAQANQIPDFLQLPFWGSVLLGIVPAAVVCIVTFLGVIFGIAFILDGILGSFITAVFKGELKWKSFISMTD